MKRRRWGLLTFYCWVNEGRVGSGLGWVGNVGPNLQVWSVIEVGEMVGPSNLSRAICSSLGFGLVAFGSDYILIRISLKVQFYWIDLESN